MANPTLYDIIVTEDSGLGVYVDDLKPFLDMLQPTYAELKTLLNGLKLLKDPQTTPAKVFAVLAAQLGWKVSQHISLDKQRRILYDIVHLYAERGSAQGYEDAFRLYGITSSEVQDNARLVAVTSTQGGLSEDAYLQDGGFYHEGSLEVHVQDEAGTFVPTDAIQEGLSYNIPGGFLIWVTRHSVRAALLPLIEGFVNTTGLASTYGMVPWFDAVTGGTKAAGVAVDIPAAIFGPAVNIDCACELNSDEYIGNLRLTCALERVAVTTPPQTTRTA